ncbi:MAG: thioredoxin [Bacteroidetes bacterium]|nr:thioredoxin [Bacteroidota bacterium]MBU1115965.1 thioredoxin [Bacteroidota bacterium]MBU1798438.1 thioredoxin [Bacteroidota bacterium]
MKPIEFTDGNFEVEVLKSELPVIIDFWAAWCAPCRMIAPIIEDLANSYEGRVKVGKLDVDTNQQTAIKYGVRSIPTVLIIKNGQVADTIIGAVSKATFVDKIEAVL